MSIAPAGASEMAPEIIEKILDQLHDDAPSLYSASLVCRAWVHAPRYHMFRRTIIKEVLVPFQRAAMLQENVEAFLYLSQSPYCTFLPAMRTVILSITSPELLEPIFKALARAESLSKVVYLHTDESAPPPSWTARALPNLREFSYSVWKPYEDVWLFLASFPHLHTVSLFENRHSDGVPIRSEIPAGASFSTIRNIQLSIAHSEELFDWMSKIQALTQVESLDLIMYRSAHKGWGPVSALNTFLRRNSRTMSHLSVAIEYHPSRPTDESTEGANSLIFSRLNLKLATDIDLSPLIHLRSLTLRTHDIDRICNSIQSIRSHLVESMTVHTFYWDPDSYCLDSERVCFCDFYVLFTKLARIMDETKIIPGTTMLDFTVAKQPRINHQYYAAGEVSVRWLDCGVLELSGELLYGKERKGNPYLDLQKTNLIWWYAFDKPTLPAFLR